MLTDAYRIDPFLAEFADPEKERAFQSFIRDVRVRDTRVAFVMAAVIYLAFAFTDFLAMGRNADYAVVFTARLSICLATLLAALFAARLWRWLVNGMLPTLVIAFGMLAFVAITLKRPYEPGMHGMSMLAMLFGVYVFVPNRFQPAMVVSVLSSAGFLWMMGHHFHLPPNQLANFIALMAVVNLMGVMTAYRTSRLQHEAFRHTAQIEEANRRLRHEVEARQQLETILLERVQRDDLTDTMSRGRFYEVADAALSDSAAREVPLSLLLLDIDYLRQINGTYGHMRGDLVLRTLADVCRLHVREHDVLARLGGEQFVILLPGLTLVEAAKRAETLRSEVQRTSATHAEAALHFTVSGGLAQWQNGESLQVLMRRADEALSKAKFQGRNRVVSHEQKPVVPPITLN